MSALFKTSFKLTQHEILLGVAATVLLQRLQRMGASERFVADLCNKPQYGYTTSSASEPVGPHFVRITDIQAGAIDWSTVPYCECDKGKNYQLMQNDILVARTGASVGKSFLVKNISESAIFASYLIRLQAIEGIANPEYLYWCFQSQQFWEQIIKARRGSAIKNVNGKMLSALRFPVPDIATQYAIANFLNGFWNFLEYGDRACIPQLPPEFAKQQRIVAKIEQLAEKVEEARNLREKVEKETTQLKASFINEIEAKLLKKFDTVELSEISHSITDGDHQPPPKSETGIPFIFISNMITGRVDFTNCKYVLQEYYDSLSRSRKAQKGDILYSAVGSYGVPCVVDFDDPFCFQRHIAIIKPNSEVVDSEYMAWMLQSPSCFMQATEFATGSAQLTVPLRAIRRLRIPLAPLEEQRRIVTYLNNVQAKVDSLRHFQAQTHTELDALLPSILDKAFRGEL